MVSKPLAGIGSVLTLAALGLLVSIMLSENFVVVQVPTVEECADKSAKFVSYLGTLGVYTASFNTDCAIKAVEGNASSAAAKFTLVAKQESVPTTSFAPLFPAQEGFGVGGPKKLENQSCSEYFELGGEADRFAIAAGFKGFEDKVTGGIKAALPKLTPLKTATQLIPTLVQDIVKEGITENGGVLGIVQGVVQGANESFVGALNLNDAIAYTLGGSAGCVPSDNAKLVKTLSCTCADAADCATKQGTLKALFVSAQSVTYQEGASVEFQLLTEYISPTFPSDDLLSTLAQAIPSITKEQIQTAIMLTLGSSQATQNSLQKALTGLSLKQVSPGNHAAEVPTEDFNFSLLKGLLTRSDLPVNASLTKAFATLSLCDDDKTTPKTCGTDFKFFNASEDFMKAKSSGNGKNMCALVLGEMPNPIGNKKYSECNLSVLVDTLTEVQVLKFFIGQVIENPDKKKVFETLVGPLDDPAIIDRAAFQFAKSLRVVYNYCESDGAGMSFAQCGNVIDQPFKADPVSENYTENLLMCVPFKLSLVDQAINAAFQDKTPPNSTEIAQIAGYTNMPCSFGIVLKALAKASGLSLPTAACASTKACQGAMVECAFGNSTEATEKASCMALGSLFYGQVLGAEAGNVDNRTKICEDDETDKGKFSMAQKMLLAGAPLIGLGGVLGLVALATNKAPVAFVAGASALIGAGVVIGALLTVRSAPVYAKVGGEAKEDGQEQYQAGTGQVLALATVGCGVLGGALTMISGCLNKADDENALTTKVDQTY